MNFFDLFKEIMDVAKEEQNKYVNVTNNFLVDLPKEIGRAINIYSDCIDLHISHSDCKLGFSIYLYEQYDIKSVKIECSTENDTTYFKFNRSESFTKGYIELSIPSSEELYVKTRSANVALKYLTAKQMELNIVNGNIFVKNTISARSKIFTQNGNIAIEDVDTQDMCVETKCGNIVLKVPPVTFNISTETYSGNVMQNGKINNHESNKRITCLTHKGNIVTKIN